VTACCYSFFCNSAQRAPVRQSMVPTLPPPRARCLHTVYSLLPAPAAAMEATAMEAGGRRWRPPGDSGTPGGSDDGQARRRRANSRRVARTASDKRLAVSVTKAASPPLRPRGRLPPPRHPRDRHLPQRHRPRYSADLRRIPHRHRRRPRRCRCRSPWQPKFSQAITTCGAAAVAAPVTAATSLHAAAGGGIAPPPRAAPPHPRPPPVAPRAVPPAAAAMATAAARPAAVGAPPHRATVLPVGTRHRGGGARSAAAAASGNGWPPARRWLARKRGAYWLCGTVRLNNGGDIQHR